ncbi:hypothetical protein, partial [Streptomyces phaeoluteigriseus]|uniref:hypothetical protein n=1 Tax=Streptomyces phaeoluteigriseus TaxID=114686 RepID=UPI001B85DDA5
AHAHRPPGAAVAVGRAPAQETSQGSPHLLARRGGRPEFRAEGVARPSVGRERRTDGPHTM